MHADTGLQLQIRDVVDYSTRTRRDLGIMCLSRSAPLSHLKKTASVICHLLGYSRQVSIMNQLIRVYFTWVVFIRFIFIFFVSLVGKNRTTHTVLSVGGLTTLRNRWSKYKHTSIRNFDYMLQRKREHCIYIANIERFLTMTVKQFYYTIIQI